MNPLLRPLEELAELWREKQTKENYVNCAACATDLERVLRESGQMWLAKMIAWELVPETSQCAGDEIRLERRDGFSGRRWTVAQRGYVLNKNGEWEWEPQPSSRTDEWLETVRWSTPEEACAALAKVKGKSA